MWMTALVRIVRLTTSFLLLQFSHVNRIRRKYLDFAEIVAIFYFGTHGNDCNFQFTPHKYTYQKYVILRPRVLNVNIYIADIYFGYVEIYFEPHPHSHTRHNFWEGFPLSCKFMFMYMYDLKILLQFISKHFTSSS